MFGNIGPNNCIHTCIWPLGSYTINIHFFKASALFFWRKSPLAAAAPKAAGRDKKLHKSFLAAVLLYASVERCFVSRMRDFFYQGVDFLYSVKLEIDSVFLVTNNNVLVTQK